MRNVDVYPQAALSNTEQEIWRTLQPSILIVSQGGASRGSAVCIDTAGYYLAHQNSIHSGSVDGVTLNGQTFPMRFVSADKPTGLILLQVVGKTLPQCPAVKVADEEHARQGTLLAVLSSGPVRADIGQPNVVATYANTNQSVMLNEIRFVAPLQLLTGALLFDDRGALVGVLGATLPKQGGGFQSNTAPKVIVGSASGGDAKGGATTVQPAGVQFGGHAGPAELNVAYAVSPFLINRVIGGFLSPTHEVHHPALGAFCSDDLVNGVSQGAIIRRINAGSGAANAGLKVGDVILNIDGSEIHNTVDYARVMLTKEVGHTVTVAIRRGDQTLPFDAIVGRVTNPEQLQQELNQILR
jgi:putative serine protease PepD